MSERITESDFFFLPSNIELNSFALIVLYCGVEGKMVLYHRVDVSPSRCESYHVSLHHSLLTCFAAPALASTACLPYRRRTTSQTPSCPSRTTACRRMKPASVVFCGGGGVATVDDARETLIDASKLTFHRSLWQPATQPRLVAMTFR